MNSWFQQLRLEVRLFNRQAYFYLLPILYGIWLAVHLTNTSQFGGNLFLHVYRYHSVQFVLTIGIAMILGILLIRRDIHRAGYGWMMSLPVKSFTQVSTKFVAGLMYMTLFTIMMALVYLYFGFVYELPQSVLKDQILFFVIQSQLSYTVTLALAILLGVLISSRIVYLISFCAWMFGTFFIDLVLITGMKAYPLITFHLSQFTTSSSLENELFGYSLYSHELMTSRLFVLTFSMLLLIAAIAYLNRVRPSSYHRQWFAGFLLILIGSFAAYYPNVSLWLDRYTYQNSVEAASPDYSTLNPDTEQPNFSGLGPVSEYYLNIINEPDNTVRFHAKLFISEEEAPATGQALTFTLNQQFHVERILLDGKETAFNKEGDLLYIDWPPEEQDSQTLQRVEFYYSGYSNEWLIVGSYPSILSYLSNQQVYLPNQSMWYPQPGKHHRFVSIRDFRSLISLEGSHFYNPPSDDVPFVLTAQGFPEQLYTNLDKTGTHSSDAAFQTFTGHASGITLLSSQALVTVDLPDEPVSIITTAGYQLAAKHFLADLHEQLNYYRSWLDHPLNEISQLIYHPTNMPYRYPDGIAIQGNTLFIDETISFYSSQYTTYYALIPFLFHDTSYYFGYDYSRYNYDQESIVHLIRSSFFYLYLREYSGYSHQEIVEGAYFSVYPLLEIEGDERVNQFFSMIDLAITNGETEHVKKVLREFHRRGLTMSITEKPPLITFKDWVEVWDSFT